MKGRGTQRGATLVEAAVTLLAFLILLIGILEFGRIFNEYQVLTDAAREGARFAVAPCPHNPSTCSYGADNLPTSADIQAQVQYFLDSAAISGSTINVTQNAAGPTVNGIALVSTQVDVSAPYSFIFFPFGTITLTSHSVMRNEND